MGRKSPTISVILPVYNGEKTVGATIRSVLEQQFDDFELLIIDDGSTDQTPDVLKVFSDPRIAVHSFENKGLAASRNRGIRLAAGEFVAFIDADDLWTADKLTDQLNALRSKTDAGLAYSLTDCIDIDGKRIGPASHVAHDGHVYSRLMARNFVDSGSNPLVRREVFDAVGGFDERLEAAEDWDFYLRVAHRYPFICLPKAQILYRIHGQTMSANSLRQQQASAIVFEAALERVADAAERERIAREGRANLSRYFARRVITTAPDSSAVKPAFGYLRQWWRDAPDRSRIWFKWCLQFSQATLLLLIPHRISRPLINGLLRMTGR